MRPRCTVHVRTHTHTPTQTRTTVQPWSVSAGRQHTQSSTRTYPAPEPAVSAAGKQASQLASERAAATAAVARLITNQPTKLSFISRTCNMTYGILLYVHCFSYYSESPNWHWNIPRRYFFDIIYFSMHFFFRLLNNIYIYVCAVDTLARNRRALHIDYDYNSELFFCFASLLPCAVRVQVQDNRERWREDKKHIYVCRAVDQRITIEMNYICMCTILSTFQSAFATNASPSRVSGVCVCVPGTFRMYEQASLMSVKVL